MPAWEESAPDPRMTNQGSLQGGPGTNENSTLGFLSLESRLLQTLMCTGFTQGVDFQDLPQESDAEALRWGTGICCYHRYRTTRPVQSPRVREEEKALQSYTASRKLRRSSPSSTWSCQLLLPSCDNLPVWHRWSQALLIFLPSLWWLSSIIFMGLAPSVRCSSGC